ncbi:hypothetical protein NDU88_008346 [Pleurodeles waltl]|uniref:Uncharacterized protein n=1 Tax=Pleurodeles waltl TaxID=8319 RepID=A0AAV7NVT1_PLEWA|nr:hypothetical protein NDU88_008346 [Pleurodeles waltl]
MVCQAMLLLEEAGRWDLVASAALPQARLVRRAAAGIAALVFACSQLRPGTGAGLQPTVTGTLKNSGELGVAQYPRGEEKAAHQAAG